MTEHTATYDPGDNKLRMYPACRLDKDDYNRFRTAGFKWAPKQELFVAPMWTPQREDLLTEFCGEVGDEDTSLVERSEERAGRFKDYSSKRAQDAESAHQGVNSITEHIPFGQPILVGHHSEKRARKDAERIENGMRKAVKMWETSEYWTRRAEGALRTAKHKERPDVRARRIKKIEADKRRQERTKKDAEVIIMLWNKPNLNLEKARKITNYLDHLSICFPVAEYPRLTPDASNYEGLMSLWSALDGIITPEQAKDLSIHAHEKSIAWAEKWISHYDNRLLYEKAMIGEQGRSDLLKPKSKPKQLPLLNYQAPEGVTIHKMYGAPSETEVMPQVEMTKAEYSAYRTENHFTVAVDNSHRMKALFRTGGGQYRREVVFLTDSIVHKKPKAIEPDPEPMSERPHSLHYTPPERTKLDDLKDTLKEGVKVVVAPQLFPTPPEIAEKMVDYAGIKPGQRVLEPSAGTGNIINALPNIRPDGQIVAVEINQALAASLQEIADETLCGDFLSFNGDLLKFDRIVMNPPFTKGEDIKHINHALTFLKPGGRLVALCANGPRQRAAFMDKAEHWEDLPQDSFKEQGTRVNTALMALTN